MDLLSPHVSPGAATGFHKTLPRPEGTLPSDVLTRPTAHPHLLPLGDAESALLTGLDNLNDTNLALGMVAEGEANALTFPDVDKTAQAGALDGVSAEDAALIEDAAARIVSFAANNADPFDPVDIDQARVIARETLAASREFNVDFKLMMATFGRESRFDADVSVGNGTGLGQLTAAAIEESDRIAGGGPDGYRRGVSDATEAALAAAQPLFGNLEAMGNSERMAALTDVRTNARAAAAYMRTMIDVNSHRAETAPTSDFLKDYNANPDSSIRNAYPGHVGDVYQELWGSAIPDTYPR